MYILNLCQTNLVLRAFFKMRGRKKALATAGEVVSKLNQLPQSKFKLTLSRYDTIRLIAIAVLFFGYIKSNTACTGAIPITARGMPGRAAFNFHQFYCAQAGRL